MRLVVSFDLDLPNFCELKQTEMTIHYNVMLHRHILFSSVMLSVSLHRDTHHSSHVQ